MRSVVTRMTWTLDAFVYESDPRRDVRLFNCAILRDGQFAGSVNFAIDLQTVFYRDLNNLKDLDLGERVIALLGQHVGGLIATGKFPRSDGRTYEIRVADDDTKAALQSELDPGWNRSIGVPTLGFAAETTGARIQNLQLEGLFGFEDVQEIALGTGLTVAVGENGSGKSSVRKVIAALQNLSTLREPFPRTDTWRHGRASEVSTSGIAASSKISVDLQIDDAQLTYAISFDVDPSFGTALVVSESLSQAGHSYLARPDSGGYGCQFDQTLPNASGPQHGLDPSDSHVRRSIEPGRVATIAGPIESTQSVLPNLASAELYPVAAHVLATFQRLRCYSAWDLVSTNGLRVDTASQQTLDVDGSNLGSVLRWLQATGQGQKFADWFSEVMDGHPVLSVETDGSLRYRHDGRNLPMAALSDGSLRWAQTIAACFADASLLVLDEPELGLHPDLIGSLADLLAETRLSKQVLVFTHSKDLLDLLEDRIRDGSLGVVTLEQEADGNVISAPDLELLRKGQDNETSTLSELWTSGLLGGNRW
jgi:predicted ATPase